MRQEMLCTIPQRVKLEIANPSEVQGTITRNGSIINIASYLNKKSLLRGDIVRLTKASNITYPTTYENTTPKTWGCKVAIQTTTSEINGEVSYTVPSPRTRNTLTASVTKVPGYLVPTINKNITITGDIELSDINGNTLTNNSIIYLGDYIYLQHNPTDTSDYGYLLTIQNSAGETANISAAYKSGLKLAVANASTALTITSITYSNFKLIADSNIEIYATQSISGVKIPSGSKCIPDRNAYYYLNTKEVIVNNVTHICRFMWLNRTFTSSSFTDLKGTWALRNTLFNNYSSNPALYHAISLSNSRLLGVNGTFPEGTCTINGIWLDKDCPYYVKSNVLTSKTLNKGETYSFTVLSNSTTYTKIASGTPLIIVTGTSNGSSSPFKVHLTLNQTASLSYGTIKFYSSGNSLCLQINANFSIPDHISYSIHDILIYDSNYSSQIL